MESVDCSFEDYVALSGARKALGPERFAARYRIDDASWTQLAGAWNRRIPTDPRYGTYAAQVDDEAARILRGGAPKPVSIPGSGGGDRASQAPGASAAANVGFRGAGMLGMMGAAALASGIGPGMQVFVHWSDGNRYCARCMQVVGTQVCVAFGDGRQLWVPEVSVTRPE